MLKIDCLVGTVFFLATISTSFAADPPVATKNSSAEERLAYMQSSGESYLATVGDNRKAKFQREPVLRFTNAVSGVVDAGLFVWKDEKECPVAVAQIFICPGTDKLWLHEFQSLTTETMKFEYKGIIAWAPKSGGIEFESIDKVGEPAKSSEARLVQMRQISRRFSVKDDFGGVGDDELRLLSTPMVRYSNENVLDGAIFAFAHGTDPELLVIVEAPKPTIEASKKATPTHSWRIALAPMTAYAISVKLDGKDFWSVASRNAPHAVTATFRDLEFPPSR
jgi:hypothetical protein